MGIVILSVSMVDIVQKIEAFFNNSHCEDVKANMDNLVEEMKKNPLDKGG